MPYLMTQGLLDPGNPYGARSYWRAYNVGGIEESMIDLFVERAAEIPSPLTAFIFLGMGGAISRVGENDTALSGRNVSFNMHLNGIWNQVTTTRRTSPGCGNDRSLRAAHRPRHGTQLHHRDPRTRTSKTATAPS